MKTIEIIGYKRANLGKSDAKRLRQDGNVPSVVYGEEGQFHFYAPMILFRPLIYTPEVYFVNLNIEGEIYRCILQDVQFHPVSDIILHADFLILHDEKPIKMGIPVEFSGRAAGIQKGGKLQVKLQKILIKALPKDMPEKIVIDISKMELGDTIKVKDVETKNFEILNNPRVTIAAVSIPRLARTTEEEEAEAAAALLESEEGALVEGETGEGESTEEKSE
ncbi:MAG: 50S ribosomal protein L25/general stress protein Ctc [Cyclobacteriaceae bacterium]|nr:50S ribosomal protein L25/general stress protein Ctc [Cyclobacteriaceae bacterium]